MKRYFYYLVVLLLTSVLFISCSSDPAEEDQPVIPGETEGEVTITVRVVDNTTGENLSDAIVSITGGPEVYDLKTDGTGKAAITFINDKSRELTITVSKLGYDSETSRLTIGIEDEESIEVKIQKKTAGSEITGPAASIVLISTSSQSIGVKESGSVETANILFEVQDSSGNPIDINNSIFVSFRFGAHPGGGEFLGPDSSKTNGQGRVYVNLNTGYKAGVVQIHAEIQPNGNTIHKKVISKPVNISIHGGHPDQNHFSLSCKLVNIHGWEMDGVEDDIMAIVGDKFANPAKPLTSVYFTTQGGIIEGSDLTDNLGITTVKLLSSNPRPVHPILGPGFLEVYGFTADENHQIVSDTTIVLFSGRPIIKIWPTGIKPGEVDTTTIPHLGSKSYDFSVFDLNGNPISSAHTITVGVKGKSIGVDGDINLRMPDTQARGEGTTLFTFDVFDDDEDEPQGFRSYTAYVTVAGPYGIARASVSGFIRK